MTRWRPTVETVDGDLHVVPHFEGEREHTLSMACWCRPVRDATERRLVVHNRVAEA